MDQIQISKISKVLWITGKQEFCGTLYLTAHQLLYQPSQDADAKEIWVSFIDDDDKIAYRLIPMNHTSFITR